MRKTVSHRLSRCACDCAWCFVGFLLLAAAIIVATALSLLAVGWFFEIRSLIDLFIGVVLFLAFILFCGYAMRLHWAGNLILTQQWVANDGNAPDLGFVQVYRRSGKVQRGDSLNFDWSLSVKDPIWGYRSLGEPKGLGLNKIYPIRRAWKKNPGHPPEAERVHIELSDGSKRWNQKVGDVDWSLSTDPVIVEYMIPEAKKWWGKA